MQKKNGVKTTTVPTRKTVKDIVYNLDDYIFNMNSCCENNGRDNTGATDGFFDNFYPVSIQERNGYLSCKNFPEYTCSMH